MPLPHRVVVLLVALCAPAFATQVPTTLEDFHVPGTQVGDVTPGTLYRPSMCTGCHSNFDVDNEPYATWSGSLMAHAGRDPLFRAQMATANQDAANVGYFCMRCHVPMSIVSGHANQPDGSTLDATDLDGVSCHFCHAMVDPIYKPGVSPAGDQAILAGLTAVPAHYGNAMFVLDPTGTRRGPYDEPMARHAWIWSPFHRSGDMCGTCHDVGNVETTLTPEGTYRYNPLDQPSPTEDLHQQFPLERTYTEWKLSAFANGGVDMNGRFGGDATRVIETCQDCHMPRYEAQGCFEAMARPDLARHDFAGAAAPVLDLIAAHYQGDPDVDQAAIARARAKAVSMLQRAASLALRQDAGDLVVRVTNETGHKLPTGHIEGRRIWINVRFLSPTGALVAEHGGYDTATATLDEASTTVYEMHVGLSPEAAVITGLPAGPTGHMSLADTIEHDNRIPPRGFTNAAFVGGGAPVVGWSYPDGQYWDERHFSVPAGAAHAEVAVYYQNTPRDYIEHLRDGNHTDAWGTTLHQLWTDTGKGAPIAMATAVLDVAPVCTTVTNSTQTRRTLVRSGQVATHGSFRLAAAGTFAPDTTGLALTITDGAGALFAGVLPSGALVPSGGGRLYRYQGTGAITRARLRIDRDGVTVRYALRGRGTTRALVAGTGSTIVQTGDRCFADTADVCTAFPSGWGTCN
ncbi:MAG: multiheme c-type cytochrome [Candidatus Binatia bacterium]